MHPEMVYAYPTWVVGTALVLATVIGAALTEYAARSLIPLEHRRKHNDVAAAIFSVIGVLFAVLLAFVAMIGFENYNGARASVATEAMVAQTVANAVQGLPPETGTPIRHALTAYLQAVIAEEWPAQAEGQPNEAGAKPLNQLNTLAAALHPSSASETNYHAALLAALARLQEARATRIAAAGTAIPGIVWFIMFLGGAMTVAAASFLGAPTLRWHMLMSATLAASGAIVVLLIIELSDPFRGDIKIPPTPLQIVLERVGY